MARIIHNDAIVGNAAKLALCGAAAAFHPVALAVGAFTAKEVIANALSLGIAVAKHRDEARDVTPEDAHDLFEKAKQDLGHTARWDIETSLGVQAEVGDFFDQAVLDLSLPAGALERFRDAARGGDVYAGMADVLIAAVPQAAQKLPTDAHRTLARGVLRAAVKSAIQAAGAQDDLHTVLLGGLAAAQAQMDAKIDALMQMVAGQAREGHVSDAAVRAYLERALDKGFTESDIVSWLPEWIERARVVFSTGGNEEASFRRAVAEAEALLEQKGQVQPSQPIMDELARLEIEEKEQAEEYRRRKVLRIEKAIEIDELALNIDGVVEKLFVWAGIEGCKTDEEVAEFVFGKTQLYREVGEQAHTTTPLLIAQRAYNAVLDRFMQTISFPRKGAALHNLGIVLRRLGTRLSREAAIKALTDGSIAYENALKFRNRQNFPLEWAATQNNLGIIFKELAHRVSEEARHDVFMKARAAFENALEVRSLHDFPHDWAVTWNNLALLLVEIADKLGDHVAINMLEEARSAYVAIIDIQNRTQYPLEWAVAHNNQGGVLLCLAKRFDGHLATNLLTQAKTAFEVSLEVRTLQTFPFHWAQTQHNMAKLAEVFFLKTGKKDHLAEGVAAVLRALGVYRQMDAGYDINSAEDLLSRLQTLEDKAKA